MRRVDLARIHALLIGSTFKMVKDLAHLKGFLKAILQLVRNGLTMARFEHKMIKVCQSQKIA